MNAIENTYCDFSIKINFEYERERPSQIFESISELIEDFYLLDKHLLSVFLIDIQSTFVLENIEIGSIKTVIRTILKSIDDDALKSFDWKKIVGSYLLKGKHLILKYLEDKEQIESIEQVKELEQGLVALASESASNSPDMLISSFPLPMQNILLDLSAIIKATQQLTVNESVSYQFNQEEVVINRKFNISAETIEELLTHRTVITETTIIMQVKKPDYLGKSMWNVYIGNKALFVKILDHEWLNQFQQRQVDVRPGDSIKGHVKTIAKYSIDNTEISITHEVLKIYDVLTNIGTQMDIDDYIN
jgi:hypothetical protein